MKILSIKFMILLDLVIVGESSGHDSSSRNSWVGLCKLLLRRSILWSMPNTISDIGLLVQILFTIPIVACMNCRSLVFSRQYMLPTTILFPFFASMSIKIVSTSLSLKMSKPSIFLNETPFLSRIDTPPPFLSDLYLQIWVYPGILTRLTVCFERKVSHRIISTLDFFLARSLNSCLSSCCCAKILRMLSCCTIRLYSFGFRL